MHTDSIGVRQDKAWEAWGYDAFFDSLVLVGKLIDRRSAFGRRLGMFAARVSLETHTNSTTNRY